MVEPHQAVVPVKVVVCPVNVGLVHRVVAVGQQTFQVGWRVAIVLEEGFNLGKVWTFLS